jgi:hypothetical protein
LEVEEALSSFVPFDRTKVRDLRFQ